MCSEIDHYSSVLRRMSENLTSSPEFESDTETVDQESLDTSDDHKKPEDIKENEETDSTDHKKPEDKEEEETDPTATVSDRKSDKQQISEDDDGFKTPTSTDHRIPALTQCPPAPKKPRPPPPKLKRKSSSPPQGARRSLHFDESTPEVEAIFGPVSNDQDDAEDQKIKKPRTDDEDRL